MIMKSIIDFFTGGFGKIIAVFLLAAILFFGVSYWKSNIVEECQRNTRALVEKEMQDKKDIWLSAELLKFKTRLDLEKEVWEKEKQAAIDRKVFEASMQKVNQDVEKEIERVVQIMPCTNLGNDFIGLLNKAQGTDN